MFIFSTIIPTFPLVRALLQDRWGMQMTFGKTTFYITRSGTITPDHKKPVTLRPSKNKKFPASYGWFTFTYNKVTYYVQIIYYGSQIVPITITGKKIVSPVFRNRKLVSYHLWIDTILKTLPIRSRSGHGSKIAFSYRYL